MVYLFFYMRGNSSLRLRRVMVLFNKGLVEVVFVRYVIGGREVIRFF